MKSCRSKIDNVAPIRRAPVLTPLQTSKVVGLGPNGLRFALGTFGNVTGE